MILASFLMLLQVFTLFELLGDILRNRISPLVVGEYLLNVAPFFLYNVLHLSILLAVLITLGLMQRSNEITAIKATGISIYRVIVPILVVSSMLAAGLFFFDQFYLPHANKRQDALRNLIKGKPAQTYLNPDRKWIFGQHSTIYYYQFFDSDRDQFGNLSVIQVRSGYVPFYRPGLRRPGALGRTPAALGVYPGLGTQRARFRHRGLPDFRCGHVCRDQRAAGLLQEGSAAVFRDELGRPAALYP